MSLPLMNKFTHARFPYNPSLSASIATMVCIAVHFIEENELLTVISLIFLISPPHFRMLKKTVT